MLAHSLFFYFFSLITVFSAVMLTISKSTVNSVFFLILVFVSVSILFIFIGAEFLGMIMLIVYVGAVAVLFLFVVMMLNISSQITKENKRKGFVNNIPIGLVFGIIIFLEIIIALGGWKYKSDFVSLSNLNLNLNYTNTHALGNVLYTDYIHLFQISGIILLVAMIGAIVLTFSKKENVKRQKYFSQIQRDKTTAISLVDVKSGEGIKLNE
jgi:NADH-quinone oxidoreductase subunit J